MVALCGALRCEVYTNPRHPKIHWLSYIGGFPHYCPARECAKAEFKDNNGYDISKFISFLVFCII